MKGLLSIAVILACAFSSSVVNAQKTSAGYDKNVDFSTFKTFAFSNTTGSRNPLVSVIIVDAIERELTTLGLTKVDANPDLRITFLAASGYDLHVASVPFFSVYNAAYAGVSGGAAATTWDITTGTLVIDLYDNKADRVVFRGTAKDVLQRGPSSDLSADAKLVSKPINKSVAKIFKKYPKPGQ